MADNLLDKASILLTPTAYNDGSMLSVKPENGDGDFTFSRGSAATRVNEQGLVENVQIISSELVSNGDFSQGSQNWSFSSGATLTSLGAKITHAPTAGSIGQSFILTIGKQYKLTYEITESISGGLKFNSAVDSSMVTSVGVHTKYFEADGTTAGFSRTNASNNDVTITNISVKEIIDDTDLPRLDYTDGCGNWLLEPQSTNLITYSEDFSDSSWAKAETIIEAANIAMPNGVINGYKLFANTSNVSHWIEVSPFPTATSGQNFTLSLFIKSAGSDFIQVASSTGFNSRYQNFNISTGTKASGDISDSSITDFGNGWYRISVTEITTGTNARYLIAPILSDVGRNPLFAGNANEDGVYIWGAQLENLSYATSYIPTNGAIATRLADAATNSGNASLINSTEGVLYAEIAALASSGNYRSISLSDGTDSNRITLYLFATNTISVFVRESNTTQAQMTYTVNDVTDFNKIAFKYKENDFELWINGVEVATDTSANVPTSLSKLHFSMGNGVSFPFYGKTKALAVYKEALTDAELQSLTTI